eukprot:c9952_g1_i1 orf=519-1334(-)
MSGLRWKYPKARSYALENPISDVYKQMQSLPLMKSFLSQTAVILQADAAQSELLNRVCIGRPILVGPQATLSCSDGFSNCAPCQENTLGDIDEEVLLYELGFEEAFFLSYELKCLRVSNKKQQEEVVLNDENLWQLMSLRKHGFSYYYRAYSHLRKKNWIVRSGLQYGVHYMAYRHHPSHVHAEYSVLVVPEWEKQMQLSSWSHMQGSIRLCGNVAKTLLLLHVTRTELNDRHPNCLEYYSVKEMEVKRWLPQKHRMDNCMESTNGYQHVN